MRRLGLHVMPALELVDTPRRSVIAEVDAGGRLVRIDDLITDADIVSAVPLGPVMLAIDTPLRVPNDGGQRTVETLLSWLDMPSFPVSRKRMQQIYGGCRGEALASLLSTPDRRLVETLPDLVLRQLSWQQERGPSAAPLGLADYRAQFLSVRPPRYRPKGTGRARADGLIEAAQLLASAVDLDGWWPQTPRDDWDAIADAARLDAIACALVAHRAVDQPAETLVLGDDPPTVILADEDMRERAAVNVARMRAEGTLITYPQ